MLNFIKKFMSILKKEDKARAKLYNIYWESLQKSYKEMNRKDLKFDDVLYLSENKMKKFRRDKVIRKVDSITENTSNEDKDTISMDSQIGVDMVGINCNHENENSKSKSTECKYSLNPDVDDIRKRINSANNNLKPYDDVNIGNYFTVKMPMISGKSYLKTQKEYKNLYFWYGYYRNLKLYLAGNIKNINPDDFIENEGYLWNPSGDQSAVKFFDDLSEYIIEEKQISELPKNMEKLELINYGTARGPIYRRG